MDASHFETEGRGELEKKVDPPCRRHQSAKDGRCSGFTGNRRVRDESYRGWSGYRKACAVLALHRVREQLVKFRTAQINGLRGLVMEYGEVMPQGRAGIKRDIPGALGRLADRLPAMVIETLREQYARLGELDEQIGQIERRLRQWQREDSATQRIAAIPGVGLLSATAAVATMGDAIY
jgi:transposase